MWMVLYDINLSGGIFRVDTQSFFNQSIKQSIIEKMKTIEMDDQYSTCKMNHNTRNSCIVYARRSALLDLVTLFLNHLIRTLRIPFVCI